MSSKTRRKKIRPMTMRDVDFMRHDAPKTTHLARYERAHDEAAPYVLYVECPHCGQPAQAQCKGN